MATFKVEIKDKIDIDKKPRVYFACHPEDFQKYFKKICNDIFKSHDCAIYYTEDMTEIITEDEKQLALGRNNLFVVPVTFKLLTTPNRAMDEDVPYAFKEHIPVLPVMMEPGLDEFYSKTDKFGELHYLKPYSADLTEISYEEKLRKYLEAVLINDKLATRVRAAFDAYIFLSYRKKDRKYANELMHIIHSHPECRDIAIWFDEFLTPGESFKENIEKILDKCKLFTLLVTPQLLEKDVDENGTEYDNYVISTELPLARKKKEEKGIDIFAVEMEKTEEDKLSAIGIEDYTNPNDKDFRTRLLEAVSQMVITPNDTPEHNYLIGLAYLSGIDVEISVEKGLQLIEKAADAKLKEAMKRLVNIYSEGLGIKKDTSLAITYQKRITEHLKERTEESPSSLSDYLSEELCLAEMEISENLLSEANNTCGRVITSCKSDGAYGKFFAEDRIEYYIRANILLGEMFEKQGDLKQCKEYLEKADITLSRLSDDQKALLSDFNCGILHYHLGKIYATSTYYDYRYTVSKFEKALHHFERCSEEHSVREIQIYIDRCKMQIAAEYEKRTSLYDQAIQLYQNLSDQYVRLDYQNNLDAVDIKAHCYYRLGLLFQLQKKKKRAKKAFQSALDISCKAKAIYETDIRFVRLFLLSSMQLAKLTDGFGDKNRYKNIFEAAEKYSETISTRDAKQLLAEIYFEAGYVKAEYWQLAYNIYEELNAHYPSVYHHDIWRFRNFMCDKQLLSNQYFNKSRLEVISQDAQGAFFCKETQTGKHINVYLSFFYCNPLGEIHSITITRYKFNALKDYDDLYWREQGAALQLQVCPLKMASKYTKSSRMQDEYVLITYKNRKSVEYGFCYG